MRICTKNSAWRLTYPTMNPCLGINLPNYDWMESVYGSPSEEIPDDAPTPKGCIFRSLTYKDANLMHDSVTGRSASGMFYLLNQTPVDWFSKRQNLVESATYGSEFMAARQAVQQIIDLRYTLRMLGVPG